ncbi:MAG TPA: hypothetical protein VFF30_14235, partial [Nitrososphaerales archaeon]|nr:hypothetical protein [Nitrososphaerales archaeon]
MNSTSKVLASCPVELEGIHSPFRLPSLSIFATLEVLRLLNHIFYRPDERFVHWLMVQPKDVDPVSDMSQFTSLPMAPAWK